MKTTNASGRFSGVQSRVEMALVLVVVQLDAAVLAVANEEHVALARELAGLDRAPFGDVVDLTRGRHVEAGFDGATIAERDADAAIGAEQAVLTDGDDLLAAARERAHDRGATADVGVLANEDTGRDTPFDHGRAFGAGIEVDEALVHHRRAHAEIRTKPDARRVSDAHPARDDVVRHGRKLVHAIDTKRCTEENFLIGDIGEHRSAARPGDIWQHADDAVEVDAVRLHLAGTQEIETQIGVRHALGSLAVVTDEGHDRLSSRIRENIDSTFVLHQELERGCRCSDIEMRLAIVLERGEAHQNDTRELIGVEIVSRTAVEVANSVSKDSCRAGILERAVQGHVDRGVARVEHGAVVSDG